MEVELPFIGEVDGGDLVAHGVGRHGWASTDFSLSFHPASLFFLPISGKAVTGE